MSAFEKIRYTTGMHGITPDHKTRIGLLWDLKSP